MSTTKSGYSRYTKLFNEEDIDKIVDIVDKHINEVLDNIKSGTFDINPKRIDEDLIGCKNCKFKDLCYKKEEDICNIKATKFSDITGGEDNGVD